MDWLAFTITALICTAIGLSGLLLREWNYYESASVIRPWRVTTVAVLLTVDVSVCVGLIAPIANN